MIANIIKFLIKWFWKEPTSVVPIKATEVSKNYVVIKYREQLINLHKNELVRWHFLSRFDKRMMAAKFRKMERNGKIKFIEIEGKKICVKNKDYENRKSN